MKRAISIAIVSSFAVIAFLASACQGPASQPAPTAAPAKPAAEQPTASKPAESKPAAQPTAESKLAAQPTAAPKAAAPAFPTRPVELVCAFAAGGGTGITAETIKKITTDEKLSPQPINISYKPGANGQIGWSYLASKKGDGHVFGMITLGFVTGPLLTESPLKLEDFTPFGLLALDELILVTNPKTPFKTVKDVIDAAKKEPKSIKVAVVGAAGVDSTVIAMMEKECGIKFNVIPFTGGAEVNAAILGGQVDLCTLNPNEVTSNVEAGKLRPIVVFGEKRMAGAFKDLPTMKELGYDVQLFNPRGVVGPAGIAKHETDFYIGMIKKVSESKEWKEYVDKNLMTSSVKLGDEFGKYLTDTHNKLKEIYKEMGVLKTK